MKKRWGRRPPTTNVCDGQSRAAPTKKASNHRRTKMVRDDKQLALYRGQVIPNQCGHSTTWPNLLLCMDMAFDLKKPQRIIALRSPINASNFHKNWNLKKVIEYSPSIKSYLRNSLEDFRSGTRKQLGTLVQQVGSTSELDYFLRCAEDKSSALDVVANMPKIRLSLT